MIRAIIFDLDGVLVQTEKMKALSYAVALKHMTKPLTVIDKRKRKEEHKRVQLQSNH